MIDYEQDEEVRLTRLIRDEDIRVRAVEEIVLREANSHKAFHAGHQEQIRKENDFWMFVCFLLLLASLLGLVAYCSYESPAELREAKEAKEKGFHCLDAWDGSHSGFVRKIKARMNDPDSFEHIETRVTSNRGGYHTIYMTFRGTNAFGGVVQQRARGTYSNATCTATITSFD